MAIQNSQGNYLKITSVKIDIDENISTANIFTNTYKSMESRVSGLTAFETIEYNVLILQDFQFADNTNPIFIDKVKINAYNTIKALPQFSDWTDC